MNNITYTEAINHIRTFKDFYCLKAIAEQINMSPAYFRNVINERYGLKNLPEKNRTDFVKVVTELCRVRQLDCDSRQHEIKRSLKESKRVLTFKEGEKFLTIKQMSEKYNINPSTLWRWRMSGKMSAIKLGGTKVLFDEAVFQRELLGQTKV